MKYLNNILRKIGIPFNAVNTVVGLVMSIAYVYIPLPSAGGLAFGVVMAVSSSACVAISYYFTTKNSKSNTVKEIDLESNMEIGYKNTKGSNVFIAALVPLIMLSSVSSYFGMYTGTILLAKALSISMESTTAFIVAIGYSVFFAVGELNNTWLQTYNIWESLRTPVRIPLERDAIQGDESAPLLLNAERVITKVNHEAHGKTQAVSRQKAHPMESNMSRFHGATFYHGKQTHTHGDRQLTRRRSFST